MNTVAISDITLRAAAARKDMTLSFKEKLETARLLDRLGVDAVELPALGDQKADELLIKTIASTLREAAVSCVAGRSTEELERAFEVIKGAARPRLHIMLPVSTVQMEYDLHLKPAATIALIARLVARGRELGAEVEFSAVDATRTERPFLLEALSAALEAGAFRVTVCDTAGTMLPAECGLLAAELRAALPALADRSLGFECGNELQMAAANAFAAVLEGAGCIKTIINQNGYPSLSAVAAIMRARGESCRAACSIKDTELGRAIKQMPWFSGSPAKKPTAPSYAPAVGRSEVLLEEGADIAAVGGAVAALGYDLPPEELARVYAEFCRVAVKKSIGTRELEAVIASAASQVPPTYRLASYVVNTGNVISSTAHIILEKQGEQLHGLCSGDGPIDAALMAIERIIGHHYELDDFQIQAVTEGREAMGETLVKLRSAGKLYSGRGISTDIIGASIAAYLNALNKIVYEEKNV